MIDNFLHTQRALLMLAENVAGPPMVALYAFVGVVFVLWIVALTTLQGTQRSRVRFVGVMWLVSAVCIGAYSWGFLPEGLRDWAHLLGLVSLSLATVRVVFLIAIEGPLRLGDRLGISRIWRDVTQAVVFIIAAVAAARAAGADARGLATTGGLVTAGLTFSLQQTLGDLVGGLVLSADAPFKVGDWIQWEAQGTQWGRVAEINWRATRITTLDHVEITVPNSLLARSSIVNFSEPAAPARRWIRFAVAYEVPPGRVIDVALSAIRGMDEVLVNPPPTCIATEFDTGGVLYALRYFLEDHARRDVIDSHVRTRLWNVFQRNGIEFQGPRTDVAILPDRATASAARQQDERELRHKLFRSVELLALLDPEDIDRLADGTETRVFGVGEIIVRKGDAGDEMFVVARGEVSVLGDDGTQIARLGHGDFFGESAVLTGEPRTATVRCDRDASLHVIGKAVFEKILAAHPALFEQLSQVVAKRQIDAMRKMGVDETQEQTKSRQATILTRMKRFFGL